MTVRFSAAAQFDLFKIAIDGLDTFGSAQVDKYQAGLQKALDFLARHPAATTEYTEYDPPVRIHPYQAHVIIYQIEDEGIFVVRVCDAREDWTRQT